MGSRKWSRRETINQVMHYFSLSPHTSARVCTWGAHITSAEGCYTPVHVYALGVRISPVQKVAIRQCACMHLGCAYHQCRRLLFASARVCTWGAHITSAEGCYTPVCVYALGVRISPVQKVATYASARVCTWGAHITSAEGCDHECRVLIAKKDCTLKSAIAQLQYAPVSTA